MFCLTSGSQANRMTQNTNQHDSKTNTNICASYCAIRCWQSWDVAGRACLLLIKRAPNRTITLNIRGGTKPQYNLPSSLLITGRLIFLQTGHTMDLGDMTYRLLLSVLLALLTGGRYTEPASPRFPCCPGNCTSGFFQLLRLSLGKVFRAKPGLIGSDLIRVAFALFL